MADSRSPLDVLTHEEVQAILAKAALDKMGSRQISRMRVTKYTTVVMENERGKKCIVAAKDVPYYKKLGLKLAKGQEPVNLETEEKVVEPYEFAAHKVDELKVMAQLAGIEGASDFKKDNLIKVLKSSGYDPREEVEEEDDD